jgi:tellurite methyltransferase
MPTHSVRFFETQFQRQMTSGELELNPFERLALPYLSGELLDLGCGLGNLAVASARAGSRVTALDGSPSGVARLRESAGCLGLAIQAHEANLVSYRIDRDFDSIVAIGLLMFFPRQQAESLLADILARIKPGGVVALNVLTEGTTFLGMFEPGHYHLFPRGALRAALDGWDVLVESHDVFPAPNHTSKVFDTLIARRPAG